MVNVCWRNISKFRSEHPGPLIGEAQTQARDGDKAPQAPQAPQAPGKGPGTELRWSYSFNCNDVGLISIVNFRAAQFSSIPAPVLLSLLLLLHRRSPLRYGHLVAANLSLHS